MTTVRTVLLLSLLLTLSLHLTTTAGFTANECCHSHAKKVVRFIQDIYKTPMDCSLKAVVVVAASGETICADPDKLWVQKAMKRLGKK